MKKWSPVLRFFENEIITHPYSILRMISKGWRHLYKLRGSVATELYYSFSHESVRAALSGILLYTGKPPDKIPVASILALVAMFEEGFYLPEGGMGEISDWMCRFCHSMGCTMSVNAKVKRIVTKQGCVQGVEVEGQGFFNVDAVISTISGMLTYSTLLDDEHVPNAMKRKVTGAPLSRAMRPYSCRSAACSG